MHYLFEFACLHSWLFKLLLGPSFFCVSYARLALINGYCELSIPVIVFKYGRFVLAPCVRLGYNSLKSCWFCDEKHLLSCCAARDTHFSAFMHCVPYYQCWVTHILTIHRTSPLALSNINMYSTCQGWKQDIQVHVDPSSKEFTKK